MPATKRTALAWALAMLAATPALAQEPAAGSLEIWDIPIGAAVGTIDESSFRAFACGTDGGPPSTALPGFAGFMTCTPDASGLREVYFEYDDERLYWALAHRYTEAASGVGGTQVFGFNVMLSLLVNEAGLVEGIRIITDPRQQIGRITNFANFGQFALNYFGPADWACTDLPVMEGYEPADGVYLDRRCEKTTETSALAVRMEHFRKPGQTRFDPNNQLNRGSYALYSAARIDITALPGVVPQDAPAFAAAPAPPPVATGDAVADFLSGAASDCPGCDLTGAALKERNLAGADLAGAILVRANLHRANLSGADLSGADLTQANLNLANVTQANLAGAVLSGAMLYAADFTRADLGGARLVAVMAGNVRLTLAVLAGAELRDGDFRDAQFVNADLRGATAELTWFDRANFFGADLSEVRMVPASFWQANLRSVTAAGANFLGSDFLEADLGRADFTNADLTGSRLFRAIMLGTVTDGAVFDGAILPNGNVAPAAEAPM
ncbi:MAG: pentapeptide repeat-containing protein [Bauldia sp.]|nr:pentapeptide repeat-containing protein [Bauldia sp.]